MFSTGRLKLPFILNEFDFSYCTALLLSISLPYDEKKLFPETGLYGHVTDYPISLPELHEQGERIFSGCKVYYGIVRGQQVRF